MDALRAVKNQFLGINPHLHSFWQTEGGWEGFHNNHIIDLTRMLRSHLLSLGYTAQVEESLQIRRENQPTQSPESDVSIYDMRPDRAALPPLPLQGSTYELVMPFEEAVIALEPQPAPFRAIAVYDPARRDGHLVAWIELLSPSNKQGGRHANNYIRKRDDLLGANIAFVELDYLHESSPTIMRLADYRQREAGSHPYRINLFDMRGSLQERKVYISQFDVDSPIPTITLPLSGSDQLAFDFNVPYQKTFEEMLYGLELVDYRQLPLHIERYMPADQAAILTRLVHISQHGVSEQSPAPLTPLPVDQLEGAAAQWGIRFPMQTA